MYQTVRIDKIMENHTGFRNEADYFWHVLKEMACEKQNDTSYHIIVDKMRSYRAHRKSIDEIIDEEGL